MKARIATAITMASLALGTWGIDVRAELSMYKMTTETPNQITTPDQVDTPIGALEFFDGVPIGDTKETVYDYMDRARAVQVFF